MQLLELQFEHHNGRHTMFSMQQAHKLVIGHDRILLYYMGSY